MMGILGKSFVSEETALFGKTLSVNYYCKLAGSFTGTIGTLLVIFLDFAIVPRNLYWYNLSVGHPLNNVPSSRVASLRTSLFIVSNFVNLSLIVVKICSYCFRFSIMAVNGIEASRPSMTLLIFNHVFW